MEDTILKGLQLIGYIFIISCVIGSFAVCLLIIKAVLGRTNEIVTYITTQAGWLASYFSKMKRHNITLGFLFLLAATCLGAALWERYVTIGNAEQTHQSIAYWAFIIMQCVYTSAGLIIIALRRKK